LTPSWLDRLSEADLEESLPAPVRELLKSHETCGDTIDDIAAWLASSPKDLGVGAKTTLPSNLWGRTRQEVYLLICARDAKYKELRRTLLREARKAKPVIVGLIAAAVSDCLGLDAGLLTPFVILCLILVVRIGKEAWCQSFADG